MVAGLIQQKQIRVVQKDTRQASPGSLPAGKLFQRSLVIVLGESQAIQCLADACLVGVAAAEFKIRLDLAVTFQHGRIAGGILHHFFHFPQLFAFGDQVLKSQKAGIPQRSFQHADRFLRQIADAQTTRAVHRAFCGSIFPGKDAQKRRFSDTIRTNDRDPCQPGNRKTDPVEDIHRTKGFPKVLRGHK